MNVFDKHVLKGFKTRIFRSGAIALISLFLAYSDDFEGVGIIAAFSFGVMFSNIEILFRIKRRKIEVKVTREGSNLILYENSNDFLKIKYDSKFIIRDSSYNDFLLVLPPILCKEHLINEDLNSNRKCTGRIEKRARS